MTQCKSCGFNNPEGMKFCGQCAAPLMLVCAHCQFENPVEFKFCGGCGYELNQFDHPTRRSSDHAAHPPAGIDNDTAERRQLTVLFCDVVGSSVLSESVDPEELREIMQKYRAVSDAVIKEHRGYTAQYLGDGILAYFGYPKANEDDAQRGVCAGIQLVKKIQQLNQRLMADHHVELNIRVGIHTGLVVVGDTRDDSQKNLALGTTPNIAARIQDYAKPNTVIISQDTYQLTQHFFECKKLGKQQLKGFSTPIDVYQARKALDINRWLAVGHHERMIPLIGREQESALILDRLSQAKAGMGQAILLNGEAGIGKSRLTQFVREHITDIPHELIEFWGTPQYQNSYLHCVINVLRQIWQLDRISDQFEQLVRIEAQLSKFDIPVQDSVPLIAELLGLNLQSTKFKNSELSPQDKKAKILELLLALFTGISEQNVIVIIAEDLHWIDPTTLELFGLLIDQVPTSRIFFLLTYRLEFQPPWLGRSHLTQISINRLTRQQTGDMIGWITKNKKLPMEVFQQIIDKTDGIPFFVEELTQMVLESNLLIEESDSYRLRNPIAPLKIPATLQDSLMARLDNLGPEKELAQIGAIVGREFSHEVLQAIMTKRDGILHDHLKQYLSNLVCSELLYQRGLPPRASYMFRHALVHEAAYQSLLKKTRHKYHRQIAEILTQNFPNIVSENPELIAHHYANGGDHLTAIKYWIIAGDTALQRCAVVDAIIHLSNGLQCLTELRDDENQYLSHELALQARLGKAYIMTRGYGDPAVEQCFSRANEISKEISDHELSFPILHGLWEYYIVRTDMVNATEMAQLMDKSTNYDAQPQLAVETKRVLGSTLFWKGEFSEAKSYLLQGLAEADSQDAQRSSNGTIQDPRVAGLSNLACLLWLTGHADQSLETANKAVSLAEKLEHPFSQAYAHLFRAVVLHLRGDIVALGQETDKLLSIANQYNFLFWQTIASMLRAWSIYQTTRSANSITQFEQALNLYHVTGSRIALSYFQSMLAELYHAEKKYDAALEILESAIEETTTRGDLFFTPELIRLKANTQHAIHKDAGKTLALLDEANNLAGQQGAHAIQLRVAISRHVLIKDANLENSAKPMSKSYMHIRNLLARITEGQDCADFVTAKRISDQEGKVPHGSEETYH